jgi:hypothetical protein
VKLATSSTYPWNATLEHDFGAEQTGSVSIYVYGQLCCGVSADLQVNRANGDWANIQQLSTGGFSTRVSVGGSQSGQSPPGSVANWHLFEIQADSNGVTVRLDGVTVLTDPRITGFRSIELDVWGAPSGAAAYFDDFRATL